MINAADASRRSSTTRARWSSVKAFVDTVMVPDLLAIAPLYIDLATVGAGRRQLPVVGHLRRRDARTRTTALFPRGAIFDGNLTAVQKVDPNDVRMYTKNSCYGDDVGDGKHPLDAGQEPIEFTKLPGRSTATRCPNGKYDWTQAARYGDQDARPMEVGPLAEMLVGVRGRAGRRSRRSSTTRSRRSAPAGKPEILMSDLGRIAARVLRAKLNADFAQKWADELSHSCKDGKTTVYTEPPNARRSGEGAGGWNAPRGALAHYIRIKDGKIDAYAAVPPTNWNLSPRDDNGVRGPLEQTLIGTPVADPTKPLEILRVVHTFDP